jgi:hypothetical protein
VEYAECVPPAQLDVAPPTKTSSTMIRAPARAIAAIPAIHAASRVRNSGPTTTSPS